MDNTHGPDWNVEPDGDPRPRINRNHPHPRVTLEELAATAGRMHIVHQLAFWLIRFGGVRLAEAFTINLADIVEIGEEGDPGLIALRSPGRRHRSDVYDGRELRVDSEGWVKTDCTDQLIVVTPSLMELVRLVVELFHTDPDTGWVDPQARLVPGIRLPPSGGQQGFSHAFWQAATVSNGADARFNLHDIRMAYVGDLSETLEPVRYAMTGNTFAQRVTVEEQAYAQFRATSELMEREIALRMGSLVVPTTKFPAFGSGHPLVPRVHSIKRRLDEIGALVEQMDTDSDA